jgi:AN1-like Zinc finger
MSLDGKHALENQKHLSCENCDFHLGIYVSRCEFCGAEVELPFECSYCGKHFCEAHRLVENHNCPNAPPRTPLGSFQSKQMLAQFDKKREIETAGRNLYNSDWKKTETQTNGNVFGHRFTVPIEVYSDEKYRDKLNKARTLDEAENIIRDYHKHRPRK